MPEEFSSSHVSIEYMIDETLKSTKTNKLRGRALRMSRILRGQSENTEVQSYTIGDFNNEILDAPKLSDEEFKRLDNNPGDAKGWYKAQNQKLREGMSVDRLRKYLTTEHLNNFRGLLPGSTWSSRGLLSKKTRIQKLQYVEEQTKEGGGVRNSLQILRDIDKVIVKLGYNLEDVKKWRKDFDVYEDHMDDIIRIYCAMRSLGYNQYPDLTR